MGVSYRVSGSGAGRTTYPLFPLKRQVYPHGRARAGGYLARGFVKGHGLELPLIVVIDGLEDGLGVGQNGQGVAADVHNDAPAVPVARRHASEPGFRPSG
jgi:hypothetical protein